MINLNVKKVTIVRHRSGTDAISFCLDGPVTFPELQNQFPNEDYSPYAQVHCRKGYAEEWLKKIGITEFTLITVP